MAKAIKEMVVSAEWSSVKAKSTSASKVIGGHCSARDWQKKAFKLLKDERFMILNAPTGSGKSWEMCLLSAHKMEADARLRTIIAVPQTIIGNGFLDAHIILPDNRKKLHWKPKHDLCAVQASSNVDYVIDFLKAGATKGGDLSARVLVCTHATLLRVYRTLAASKQLRLLDDLVLWIDEAHHVKNVEMVNIADEAISNGIGELARHMLNPKKRNVHLGLATASFFRGDRCTLLTTAMEDKFVRFNLPYDVYLAGMEHLKSFTISFMMGDHDYMLAIEKLVGDLKERRKSIIHFPHPMHRHARGDKLQDVADFKSFAKRMTGGKIEEMESGLTVVEGGGSPYKILDLVDITNRDAKKQFTQSINTDKEALDAILAVGMFKEGANWIYADQAIIVGHRDSLVDIVQMIGRLFRDCPGKSHVDIVMVLPWSLDQSDREKFRENLNDYLKAIYAMMILEDVLAPPTIKEPASNRNQPGASRTRVQRFMELIPDENRRRQLLYEGGMTMARLADEANELPPFKPPTFVEYVEAVRVTMEQSGVPARISADVADCVVLRHAIRTLKNRGYDVRNIAIELLESVNPVDHIVDFINRNAGPATFRDFRLAMSSDGTVPMPWELQKKLAHEALMRGEVDESLEEAERHADAFNRGVALVGGAA